MFNKFLIVLCIGFFANTALAANEIPTLGSITAQRGVLEDLNLQVQIQEQSQKLNQLLTPVIQVPSDLTAKQLMEKLEVPGQADEKDTAAAADGSSDNRSSKVIAIYSNNNTLKAKIKYKGKVDTVTNGQTWNGLKVQVFRDRVLLGNKTLEL